MMLRFSRTIAAICIAIVSLVDVPAQHRTLTIEDLYEPGSSLSFSGPPPGRLTWMPDGKHYLQRKVDPQTRRSQLLKINAATGEASPFYDTVKMAAAFARLPGFGAEEARRLASGTMQLNDSQTAALINSANDLFYYQFGSDRAVRLTNTAEDEVGEEFSPDGRLVSFVRDFNLYVVDIESQRERSLTIDGNRKLLNGRLDWVYQEELYGRGDFKAYWWNPDSTKIVYLQLDESPVRDFVVVDHLSVQQNLEVTSYPKSGAPNPGVRIGIVSVAGGQTRWLDMFRYQSVEPLVVRVGWKPDGSRAYFMVQNREQNWLDLNFADPVTGKVETAFRETSPAWVERDNYFIAKWLKDGSFLWSSERSGWQHLYHYSIDCKLIQPVTSGKWEVRSVHGVDEASGWIYFSGTERSPIGSDVYRIKLDGSGLQRLTEIPGTHNATFDPSFNQFLDTWSDAQTPPQVRLHSADGKIIRVIDENRVALLGQLNLGKPEFLQVKTRDGFVMEAMMIKPPDFDPAKKYPVYSHTYGGPHSQQVRNAWGGATFMWHQLLAQKGYVIWICDNRSASGKGVESARAAFKQLGVTELQDVEDGVAWLKQQPWVDGARIGINGWSYGGFMTAYALTHSTSFKIGIAGAPVTDWRLYDSIYTERYMGTPPNNMEGYERSSVLKAAKNLSGKLLLIHGAIDDNVHIQNSIQFIYELEKAGKQFNFMMYPRSRHGVSDPQLVKHMREMMLKFILENL
ncbi:MAG: S9 family peptidase [Acidobacteriota bacterium]